MPAIDVQAISKRFDAFVAVDAVSFAVQAGEIFGVLGPNGAGKSTLIRMLTTLTTPSAGTALVGGCDIRRDPDGVRRAIGVIPQNMTSDLELSVEENLLIFAKLYGVPRKHRSQWLRDLIEAVGLTQWSHRPVKCLSGGMRRRVEIARGLVHQPRILFLDEPTTGLDPVSRAAVWDLLQRVKSMHELTVLLTTHYLDEADRLCDRVAIVDRGHIVALDTPLKLKASVPGKSVLDTTFSTVTGDWEARVSALCAVERITRDGHAFRIASSDGPKTTQALLAAAEREGIQILSLAVQSTTLDDVFVQYTGRQLRDGSEQERPTPTEAAD